MKMKWCLHTKRFLLGLGALFGIAAGVLSASPPAVDAADLTVRLTVYLPTGNPTYSGHWPYYGSAACSWNLPLGTVLELSDGHQVICIDRGRLGNEGWVDLYVPDFSTGSWLQRYYGEWITVRIVRWGW
jgi:hypothetical protein